MKLAGCLMLISGWIIVLAALALLNSLPLRASFIGAGMFVEAIGLGLLSRGQVNSQRQAHAIAASLVNRSAGARSAASSSGFGGYR